jgi:ATP-dependent helicase HrpA
LAGRLASLRKRELKGEALDRELGGLLREIGVAEERVAARRRAVPARRYPEELPVCQRREEIARAIEANQVVVLCGETGSGKTTQLPKICLDVGRGVRGLIGHTQPRRIAATSVAARVAWELGTGLGEFVGFKIRFGDKTSERTVVKMMTDGILLAETETDRLLEQYDTIIIDEAHERSLNIDFLLGYLKTLLPKRPDLKVIVTSATIDPERFAKHFAGRDGKPAPIISVSGRTYPVEVVYHPLPEESEDDRDWTLHDHIVEAIDELARKGEGDILVFLPGEREIREVAEDLTKHRVPGTERLTVLPLYSRLTSAEQQRVFEPIGGRRIVLSTNVAETSVTVPGIRYVIDPGYARLNRYSGRTKVQRLEVEPISRASADQRKGRCGRVGPGVCVRLYSEEDFKARGEFTDPEIVRSNLAAVILRMKALRLGEVDRFPFVEPPDSRQIKDGYETLHELGAVDEGNELTKVGRELSRLPLDPRIGRMLLAAHQEGCLSEMLVIASALSVQDPRERPMEKADEADGMHAKFKDAQSDFGTYQKLWAWYRGHKEQMGGAKLRRVCKEHFLSFMRMREWEEVHRQIAALVEELGYKANEKPSTPESVHRALLAGLLSNIGMRNEQGEYVGARGMKFNVFPGSALFRSQPKWVMGAEIVRTSRVYARTVAPLRPEWVESIAKHLLKKSYSDPHWVEQTGTVVAHERALLFGMEIYAKRRVHYGPINPAESRQLFIHHALVEGEIDTSGRFLRHNMELREQIRELEQKARRLDLLADHQTQYEFYSQRIPQDVYTTASFERWRAQAEKEDAEILFMRREDLLAASDEPLRDEQFPDTLNIGGAKLPLRYKLEPAAADDGVTIRLPLEAVSNLDERLFEWLVPGMLEEKVGNIVKALPKHLRRALPHPSAFLPECVSQLGRPEGSLYDRLATIIRLKVGVEVSPDEMRVIELPAHSMMNFEVVDGSGQILAQGRSLGAIRVKLAPQIRDGFARLQADRVTRDGIKKWDFGDLPERVQIRRFGMTVDAFPGLVDRATSVSIRLFETKESAEEATRFGLRRLCMLAAAEDFNRYTQFLPAADRLAFQYSAMGKASEFKPVLRELIADRAFLADQAGSITPERYPRDDEAFEKLIAAGLSRLGRAMDEVVELVSAIFAGMYAVRASVGERPPAAWGPVLNDLKEQLDHLAPPGFLGAVPYEWLRHYPRYLAAIQRRVGKLVGDGLTKDLRKIAEFQAYWRGYVELSQKSEEGRRFDAALHQYRWMLEEYRVSLFAQELRTSITVSPKRLEEQWALLSPKAPSA